MELSCSISSLSVYFLCIFIAFYIKYYVTHHVVERWRKNLISSLQNELFQAQLFNELSNCPKRQTLEVRINHFMASFVE